jgi:hypothetical protein
VRRETVPTFIVNDSGDNDTLSRKYAEVQFNRTVAVNYCGVYRLFQSSEVVNLPYPLIRTLLDMPTSPIMFRSINERFVFEAAYA